MNILHAIASLKENGGFSYNVSTGELNPTKGFMVAVSKEGEQTFPFVSEYPVEALAGTVAIYVKENADKLLGGNRFVGGWIENNTLYLDVSQKVRTAFEASRLCKKRQQKAYYDCRGQREVYVIGRTVEA